MNELNACINERMTLKTVNEIFKPTLHFFPLKRQIRAKPKSQYPSISGVLILQMAQSEGIALLGFNCGAPTSVNGGWERE